MSLVASCVDDVTGHMVRYGCLSDACYGELYMYMDCLQYRTWCGSWCNRYLGRCPCAIAEVHCAVSNIGVAWGHYCDYSTLGLQSWSIRASSLPSMRSLVNSDLVHLRSAVWPIRTFIYIQCSLVNSDLRHFVKSVNSDLGQFGPTTPDIPFRFIFRSISTVVR